MPELPEVEIVARRLNTALVGAGVDSAVAPGMNVMKTFEPGLEELEGRKVTGVRRVGKMPVVATRDYDRGGSTASQRLRISEQCAATQESLVWIMVEPTM